MSGDPLTLHQPDMLCSVNAIGSIICLRACTNPPGNIPYMNSRTLSYDDRPIKHDSDYQQYHNEVSIDVVDH
jgi:hypothetical protein